MLNRLFFFEALMIGHYAAAMNFKVKALFALNPIGGTEPKPDIL
jgi:hypothetical protein